MIADVHTVTAILSKEFQSDANLIIDVPTFSESAKTHFEKLKTSLGPTCTRRLQSLIAIKYPWLTQVSLGLSMSKAPRAQKMNQRRASSDAT
jgi:hypothetical protein